jgi:hypothetical protein
MTGRCNLLYFQEMYTAMLVANIPCGGSSGMRRTTTDRIYDGGPIILYYTSIVLQLPTVFSTVTCCTGV